MTSMQYQWDASEVDSGTFVYEYSIDSNIEEKLLMNSASLRMIGKVRNVRGGNYVLINSFTGEIYEKSGAIEYQGYTREQMAELLTNLRYIPVPPDHLALLLGKIASTRSSLNNEKLRQMIASAVAESLQGDVMRGETRKSKRTI